MIIPIDQLLQPTLGAFDERRGSRPGRPGAPRVMSAPRGFARRGVLGARRDMRFHGNRFENRGMGRGIARYGWSRGAWRGGQYWPGTPQGGYGGQMASDPGGPQSAGDPGDQADDSQQQPQPQGGGGHHHQQQDDGGGAPPGGGGFSLHNIPTIGWVGIGAAALLLLG